jgi:tetratricopeptide (TPR) repeat protein
MNFMAKQRAKRHYDEATRALMNLPPSSSTPYAVGWLTTPLLKSLKKAIQHLQKAVKLDSNFADAFHNLALALYRLGEDKQVMIRVKQAKLDIALASSKYKRDLKYLELNVKKAEHDINSTFELALDSADRAISIRYDFPQAHNTRAMILAKLFRLDEAMKATEVALSQAPDYKNANENREKIKEFIRERATIPGYKNEDDFLRNIDELKRQT